MSEADVLPELKQIIGALLFVAKQPLTLAAMRRSLQQVAEKEGGATRDFARATEPDLAAALQELKIEMATRKLGFHVAEVAHGFKLENDVNCGPWLRQLLETGRDSRLSRPARETLAIVAYRQPCTRPEIEAVRGVAVDEIIHNLLELQLIRVVGRSALPGKPWQYGTTQTFLEHFGLNSLDDLPGIEELRRMENEQFKKREQHSTGEVPGVAPEPAPAAAAEADEELTEELEHAEAGEKDDQAAEAGVAEAAGGEAKAGNDDADDDEDEDDEDDEEDEEDEKH